MNTLETMYQPNEIKQKGQRMMESLHKSDQPFDIPGNFRAKQRRTRFDNSQMVFPKHTESKSKNAKMAMRSCSGVPSTFVLPPRTGSEQLWVAASIDKSLPA